MHCSSYVVNAFGRGPFTGNPAAVMPLAVWLPDDLLQSIAAQHNLSETAFVGPAADVAPLVGADHAGAADPASVDAGLRWFTPAGEVELCGHATMAAAHALLHHRSHPGRTVRFLTRSGVLSVELGVGRVLTLDLPAMPVRPSEAPKGLAEALGVDASAIREVHASRDLIVVLDDPGTVAGLAPDPGRLAALDAFAVAVTAEGGVPDVEPPAEGDGDPAPVDAVSRFFAPKEGIAEDPATGSLQAALVPFWAERLGRSTLRMHQASARGGWFDAVHDGDRVRLSGRAETYSHGTAILPTPPGLIAPAEDPRAARRRARAERAAAST